MVERDRVVGVTSQPAPVTELKFSMTRWLATHSAKRVASLCAARSLIACLTGEVFVLAPELDQQVHRPPSTASPVRATLRAVAATAPRSRDRRHPEFLHGVDRKLACISEG